MVDKDEKRLKDVLREAESQPAKFGPVFKLIKQSVENGQISTSVAASTIENQIKVQNGRQSGRDSGQRKAASYEPRNAIIREMADKYRKEKKKMNIVASKNQIAKDIPGRAKADLDADDRQTNEKKKLSDNMRTALEEISGLDPETIRGYLKDSGA